MQQPMSFYRLRDLSDLFVDACIRDEAGRLMFLSVYGRDTAIQQLLAALHLPTSQGGLDVLVLQNPEAELRLRFVRAFVGDADRLSKHTGKLPRCLFGQLVHAWIYDPLMITPDKSNGVGWVMVDTGLEQSITTASQDRARDAVWFMVCHLSPIPLLSHWRDTVLTSLGGKLMLNLAATTCPPIGRLGAARVTVDDTFPSAISAMVKTGQLALHPDEKPVMPERPILLAA